MVHKGAAADSLQQEALRQPPFLCYLYDRISKHCVMQIK